MVNMKWTLTVMSALSTWWDVAFVTIYDWLIIQKGSLINKYLNITITTDFLLPRKYVLNVRRVLYHCAAQPSNGFQFEEIKKTIMYCEEVSKVLWEVKLCLNAGLQLICWLKIRNYNNLVFTKQMLVYLRSRCNVAYLTKCSRTFTSLEGMLRNGVVWSRRVEGGKLWPLQHIPWHPRVCKSKD